MSHHNTSYSDLIQGLKKKQVLREAEIFVPSEKGEDQWTCPFCEPPAYTLKLPPRNEIPQTVYYYKLISSHIQVHREHVLNALTSKQKAKALREDRAKNSVRWADGTVADNRWYEKA